MEGKVEEFVRKVGSVCRCKKTWYPCTWHCYCGVLCGKNFPRALSRQVGPTLLKSYLRNYDKHSYSALQTEVRREKSYPTYRQKGNPSTPAFRPTQPPPLCTN